MVMKYETPIETVGSGLGGTDSKQYSHDAFGMIGVSVVTHNDMTLFGSDLNHGQSMRITIKRAKLERSLSRDWIYANDLVAEITLSQHQFAEMITAPNRGDGVPCTINYAPVRGTKIEAMPGIRNIESKAEILRNEVKNSAKQELDRLRKELSALRAEIEKPSPSKKSLKEAMHSIDCVVGNIPSNLEFVVEQAEETLAKAVSSAKMEVEAYIGNAINKLGVEAARSIGLTSATTVDFIENGSAQ